MNAAAPALRDPLARAMLAAWVNCAPEQLPVAMQAHTCAATMEAWQRVGLAALDYFSTTASGPAGKLDRDFTARRIKELLDEGDGFWTACSGCQEGEDGYVSEKDYPFDPMFRCQPGSGCSECGGIGVLWDDGRGYDDLTGLRDAQDIQRFNVGDWVSHNAGLIEDHTKRQITTVLAYDPNGGVQYQLVNIHGCDRGMAYDCELDAWPDDDAALPMASPRNAEVG